MRKSAFATQLHRERKNIIRRKRCIMYADASDEIILFFFWNISLKVEILSLAGEIMGFLLNIFECLSGRFVVFGGF